MRRFVIVALALTLSGCTSQFALGPAAWSTVPPVIPGFTPLPLPGGGFVEEPNSMLNPPPAAPAETPRTRSVRSPGLEQGPGRFEP